MPDGAVFCSYCGARQSASASRGYNSSAASAAAKGGSNLTLIIIIIAIVLVAARIAVPHIFGSSDSDTDDANPEYLAIFSGNDIEEPDYSRDGLETRYFAVVEKDSEGSTKVDVIGLCCDGDEIIEIVDTLYIDLSHITGDDAPSLRAAPMLFYGLKYNSIADDTYCFYSSKIESDHVVVELTFTGLDDAAARSLLNDTGLIKCDINIGNVNEYISVRDIADDLLSQGYIEK